MAKSYRYTECGLSNVFIEGIDVLTDHAGEETYTIPNVRHLHQAIAHAIVVRASGLAPEELRFLRTEMGLTQAELAAILNVAPLTVGRWERGETPCETSAECLIRLIAASRLKIGVELSPEELARRCVWSATTEPIRIDGSDPTHYRPQAA